MIKDFMSGGDTRAAAIGTYVGLTVRYVAFALIGMSAVLYWIN